MDDADKELEIGFQSVYDHLRRQDADLLTDRPVYTKSLTGPEQAVSNSEIDWVKVGQDSVLGGVTAGAGVAAGQGTVIALTESQLGYSLMRNIATSIGLPSTSLAINLAGSWVGGSLASILYSYGGVWTGAYEIEEANRSAIIGTMATTGGVAAYGGTLGLATAIGSASSGSAISTLSGSAASNAALAWLGGGAVSAGGGGMATGAVVLGGVVTVAVVAVTASATYGFYLYDSRQEDIRRRSMIDALLNDRDLLKASIDGRYQ